MQAFGSKQPYDEYYVTFNFVNLLKKNIIQSAAVSVVDSLAADVTSTLTDVTKQTISGQKVKVWIRAGTTGKTYTITCKIVGSTVVEKYELEATLTVTET